MKRGLFARLTMHMLLLLPLAAAAQLTPQSYMQAAIEAREVTLAGMEQRLTLLQSGADLQTEMTALAQSEARVEAVFQRYGTSAAKHAAYAAVHADEIAAWLEANPELQTRLGMLQTRVVELSHGFDSVRGRQ